MCVSEKKRFRDMGLFKKLIIHTPNINLISRAENIMAAKHTAAWAQKEIE